MELSLTPPHPGSLLGALSPEESKKASNGEPAAAVFAAVFSQFTAPLKTPTLKDSVAAPEEPTLADFTEEPKALGGSEPAEAAKPPVLLGSVDPSEVSENYIPSLDKTALSQKLVESDLNTGHPNLRPIHEVNKGNPTQPKLPLHDHVTAQAADKIDFPSDPGKAKKPLSASALLTVPSVPTARDAPEFRPIGPVIREQEVPDGRTYFHQTRPDSMPYQPAVKQLNPNQDAAIQKPGLTSNARPLVTGFENPVPLLSQSKPPHQVPVDSIGTTTAFKNDPTPTHFPKMPMAAQIDSNQASATAASVGANHRPQPINQNLPLSAMPPPQHPETTSASQDTAALVAFENSVRRVSTPQAQFDPAVRLPQQIVKYPAGIAVSPAAISASPTAIAVSSATIAVSPTAIAVSPAAIAGSTVALDAISKTEIWGVVAPPNYSAPSPVRAGLPPRIAPKGAAVAADWQPRRSAVLVPNKTVDGAASSTAPRKFTRVTPLPERNASVLKTQPLSAGQAAVTPPNSALIAPITNSENAPYRGQKIIQNTTKQDVQVVTKTAQQPRPPAVSVQEGHPIANTPKTDFPKRNIEPAATQNFAAPAPVLRLNKSQSLAQTLPQITSIADLSDALNQTSPSLALTYHSESVGPTPVPSASGTVTANALTQPVLQHLQNIDLGKPYRTEIVLSPEELGKLRVIVQPTDAGVVVALQAERPETLELMRRHVDILSQELRNAGYDSIQFDFSSQYKSGNNSQKSAASAGSTALEATTEQPIPFPPAQRTPSDRLDIRL